MTGANLGELAGTSGDRILMAISAGSGIKYGTQAGAGVVVLLETALVQRVCIAGRLYDSVADGWRAGILRKCRRVKAGGCFGGSLLGNTGKTDGHYTGEEDDS